MDNLNKDLVVKTEKITDRLFISFAEVKVPEYSEPKLSGRDYVSHGANNLYPNYLLDKYSKSPKHGAIIKGKVKYIVGKGFEFKDKAGGKLKDRLKSMNRYGESLTALGRKATEDLEIYGGFYLQVIWNKAGGISDIIHLDYHKVRSNEDNTKFYYKKDWRNNRGELKTYEAFNPDKRTGTAVYFHKEYRAGVDTYTLPDYAQALTYIEADILVAEHILNNAKTGFTASKSITFTDGEPETEEEKRAIESGVKSKFTGEKGSKVLISFVDKPELAPIITDLGASDLTKEDFTVVENIISQNIYASHSITSPALFGIKQEGQLGGSTELRNAYEIFKNTYSQNKSEAIEDSFNKILTAGALPEVKLMPLSPIGYDLSEIKDIAPKEYILKEILGINPEDYPTPPPPGAPGDPANPDNPAPDKGTPGALPIDKTGKGSAEAVKAAAQAKDDELLAIFAEFGIDKGEAISIKKRKLRFADDLDDADGLYMAFADFTEKEQQIAELIRKDPRITAEVLGDAVNLTPKAIGELLADMEDRGLISSKTEKVGTDKQIVRTLTDEGKKAIKDRKALKTSIKIMYSYDGPQDDRNRPFCARLMELNRYYSRTEIESISQRVGYSVWERRGGFYHNPDTGITTPYCRHRWSQEIVLVKKKKD